MPIQNEYKSTLKYKLISMIQTYHNRKLMRRRVKVRNKVFCLGLNKTGTTSWAKAMRELGYVVGSEIKATMCFYDWVSGDYSNIIDYCRTDGEAFQDIPFSLPGTFLELDAAFPESKFILTTRGSAEQWYNSLIRFHGEHWSITGRFPPSPEDLARVIYLKKGFPADYCHNVFKTPISDPYNREILLEFYMNYNDEIEHYFKDRPGDLLVLNVAEPKAFNNLCEFLGLPLATDTFPWENKH